MFYTIFMTSLLVLLVIICLYLEGTCIRQQEGIDDLEDERECLLDKLRQAKLETLDKESLKEQFERECE